MYNLRLILSLVLFSITTQKLIAEKTAAMPENTSLIKSKEQIISLSYGNIWLKKFFTNITEINTPLIILHGGPGASHDSYLSLQQLAKNRPVIFYDQSGCGKSFLLPERSIEWSLEHYVKELDAILNALELTKVIILGHSWGGALATEYTLQHQDRVESLILASPLLSTQRWIQDCKKLLSFFPIQIQNIIEKHESAGTTEAQEYQDAALIFYQKHLLGKSLTFEALNLTLNMNIYKAMWGPSEFTATGNLVSFNRLKDLSHVKIPTLITCGEFDEATPETMREAHSYLTNSSLIIFENSAHFAHVDTAEKYCHVLDNFLKN